MSSTTESSLFWGRSKVFIFLQNCIESVSFAEIDGFDESAFSSMSRCQ